MIIEDDSAIGKPLRLSFEDAGMQCVWASDGEKGLKLAATQKFDVLILDLMLPGRNGLDVLRGLRAQGIRTPVIVVTALGALDDRLSGLGAGADDYLVKPFAFVELVARMHAVCRRMQDRPAAGLRVGELALDRTTRKLTRGGVEFNLSPIEYRLVEYFMNHAGELITRKMLFKHLWNASGDGADYIIDVHINRLRNKLDRHADHSLIETIRGRGYVLRAP